MEFERLLALATKKSGLTREEIRHNLHVKRREFQMLIPEEDALKMMLQELGVLVPEEEPPFVLSTLLDVAQHKLQEASLVARILQIYSPKNFDTGRKRGTVCNVEIADGTRKGTLVLWDEDVWLMERQGWERNDVLEMRRLQAKNFNPPELHSSLLTEFRPASGHDEFPKSPIADTPLSQLRDGAEVDAQGRVIEVGELRAFERNGKPGKVLNAKIIDGEGTQANLVLWDYYAESANRRLKIGDAVKLEAFQAKTSPALELQATWRSHLIVEPRRHTLETREKLLSKTAPEKTLGELQAGERGLVHATLERIVKAEVKGAEVSAEAELSDASGKKTVSFKGREALQLLGLKHPPTVDLQLVLTLKEEHLKARKISVILQKDAKTAALQAEHVVKIP